MNRKHKNIHLKFSLLTIAAFGLATISASAQLMDGQKKLTRADSLRGTLSPERTCFDVKFYHLNIKVDPKAETVAGYNDISLEAENDFKRIQIDLFENMKVDSITWKGQQLNYSREYNAVFINFPETITKGSNQTLRFYYSGKPIVAARAPWDGGFIWKKDAAGSDWVGVACQGTGASLWWPNKDHQSDEPDSMMISVAVPSDLMDVSNGRLRKKEDLGNGFTRYDWFVSNPINNYDVTINIANYKHFSDKINKLDLDYYVLPENLEKAKKQFQQVKPMITCFEKYFGDYPFTSDGYKLVDTHYLGMEHQSAVAYGNKYTNGYLGRDLYGSGIQLRFDYIIIHESGHEWFGNSVTAKDIADMWIHEAFTSYAEAVYVECMYGHNDYLKYVNSFKTRVLNDGPIIGPYGVNQEGSADMYPKGALMLSTIRSIIDNDAVWFSILKGIPIDFRHKTTSTDEIITYMNRKTGMDLTKVFYQYLKYAHIPELQLKKEGNATLYRWKADVPGFDMPVKIDTGKGWQLIKPGSEWKRLENIQPSAIKFATDLYYFNVSRQ
ncbi:M1 family metallopeptidase [Solitalea koreensis]|uniref:Peptidase family M1 n=1 Tax=Solitalea koreensis TaxID=543615 RepID=A0A521C0E6_9SPHI|nr:M1 family metallopeptidase [Solitalea koreensis]SMO52825.1 Peptidase family M1 [Solitalea koreensis]